MGAIHVVVEDEYGTYYYIDSQSSNDVLTKQEMLSNAKYFTEYCRIKYPGWTREAIAAMLGNARCEGILNPCQWQYGGGKSRKLGFGLFQWTPATKYLNWVTGVKIDGKTYIYKAMIPQIYRVYWEAENKQQWIKTSKYPITFKEFLTGSGYSTEYLAKAWLYNYERPAKPAESEQTRVNWANYYKDYIHFWYDQPTDPSDPETPPIPEPGNPPAPPPDDPKIIHLPLPLYMYPRPGRRFEI